jgi:phosphatidylglycerol phospholipase C
VSADGYVVITHDVDTFRIFGEKHNINETNYFGVLNQLLTLDTPRSKIPLFEDLLNWCVEVNDNLEISDRKIKLMLDIKSNNDPAQLYNLIWKEFELVKGIDYWRDKIIFGIWRSDFYIPEKLNNFKIVNITFDVYAAKKFYDEIKQIDENAKLHAISVINLHLYRKNDSLTMIKWLDDNKIKLWYWTINNYLELQRAKELATLPNGELLLEGIITDDPIGVLDESVSKKVFNWKYNLKWWIKTNIYSVFLFFFRRGYNLKPFFILMKKIGFI